MSYSKSVVHFLLVHFGGGSCCGCDRWKTKSTPCLTDLNWTVELGLEFDQHFVSRGELFSVTIYGGVERCSHSALSNLMLSYAKFVLFLKSLNSVSNSEIVLIDVEKVLQ